MVNPFKDVFAGIDEYTEARLAAENVGLDAGQAVRMGILCAQLGVWEEDIAPMAKSYMMLRDLNVSGHILRHTFTQLSKAYYAAHNKDGVEPTNY